MKYRHHALCAAPSKEYCPSARRAGRQLVLGGNGQVLARFFSCLKWNLSEEQWGLGALVRKAELVWPLRAGAFWLEVHDLISTLPPPLRNPLSKLGVKLEL